MPYLDKKRYKNPTIPKGQATLGASVKPPSSPYSQAAQPPGAPMRVAGSSLRDAAMARAKAPRTGAPPVPQTPPRTMGAIRQPPMQTALGASGAGQPRQQMAGQAATRMLQPTAPAIPPTQPRGPAVPLPAAPPPPRGEQVYQPLGISSFPGTPDPGVMGMPQQAAGAADLQLEKPPVTTEEKLAGVTSPEFYQKWAQPGQYYDPKTGTYKELIPGGEEVSSQDIQAEALAMLEKRDHEGYGMSEGELQQAKDVVTSQMYDQFTQIAEEMAWSGRAGAGGLLARGFGRAGAGAAQELKKLFVANAKMAIQEKIAYIDRMLQMYGAKLNAETVMMLQAKREAHEKEMFAMEEEGGTKTEGFAMRQDVAYQAGAEGWDPYAAQAIDKLVDEGDMTYDEAAQYFEKGKDNKMHYKWDGDTPPVPPPKYAGSQEDYDALPEWEKAFRWYWYGQEGSEWKGLDEEEGISKEFYDTWLKKVDKEEDLDGWLKLVYYRYKELATGGKVDDYADFGDYYVMHDPETGEPVFYHKDSGEKYTPDIPV